MVDNTITQRPSDVSGTTHNIEAREIGLQSVRSSEIVQIGGISGLSVPKNSPNPNNFQIKTPSSEEGKTFLKLSNTAITSASQSNDEDLQNNKKFPLSHFIATKGDLTTREVANHNRLFVSKESVVLAPADKVAFVNHVIGKSTFNMRTVTKPELQKIEPSFPTPIEPTIQSKPAVISEVSSGDNVNVKENEKDVVLKNNYSNSLSNDNTVNASSSKYIAHVGEIVTKDEATDDKFVDIKSQPLILSKPAINVNDKVAVNLMTVERKVKDKLDNLGVQEENVREQVINNTIKKTKIESEEIEVSVPFKDFRDQQRNNNNDDTDDTPEQQNKKASKIDKSENNNNSVKNNQSLIISEEKLVYLISLTNSTNQNLDKLLKNFNITVQIKNEVEAAVQQLDKELASVGIENILPREKAEISSTNLITLEFTDFDTDYMYYKDSSGKITQPVAIPVPNPDTIDVDNADQQLIFAGTLGAHAAQLNAMKTFGNDQVTRINDLLQSFVSALTEAMSKLQRIH